MMPLFKVERLSIDVATGWARDATSLEKNYHRRVAQLGKFVLENLGSIHSECQRQRNHSKLDT